MERFYHIRARNDGDRFGEVLTNGGATVLIRQAVGMPLHVEVQTAHCNPIDVFSKAKGRGTASMAPVELVCVRDLPRTFNELWRRVQKKMKKPAAKWGLRPDYNHLIRDWMPTEGMLTAYYGTPEPGGGAPEMAVPSLEVRDFVTDRGPLTQPTIGDGYDSFRAGEEHFHHTTML